MHTGQPAPPPSFGEGASPSGHRGSLCSFEPRLQRLLKHQLQEGRAGPELVCAGTVWHGAELGCPAASHGSHPSHPTEQISHLLVPPRLWLAVPGARGKATATSKNRSTRSQGVLLCQSHPDPKPPRPLSRPQPGGSTGQTLLAAAAGFGHLLEQSDPHHLWAAHTTAAAPGRAAGPTSVPMLTPDVTAGTRPQAAARNGPAG